jgi:hypothetical protein
LLDEETVSQGGTRYATEGFAGLQNQPHWGGEHGQRGVNTEELEELTRGRQSEAMPGTQVGSGWSGRAILQVIRERLGQS